MRQQKQTVLEVEPPVRQQGELDLVVPFTTPELTRIALDAASRLGGGLSASIRLLRVQVVPFPLDLDQSPVYAAFLKEQMEQFKTTLPVKAEICMARDLRPALLSMLRDDSVVVLATRKRPWRTSVERLASALRRGGRRVILVGRGQEQRGNNA